MKKAAIRPPAAAILRRLIWPVIAPLLLVFSQGCYDSRLAGDPLCTGETCGDVAVMPDFDEPEPAVVEVPAPVCDDAACMEHCLALGFSRGACGEDGSCVCEQDPEVDELCGDGMDNDRDGLVDEGCECVPGERGACFEGPPESRGVGPCRDGARVCYGDALATRWGPCEGSVLPADEICDDSMDNDCDGAVDLDDEDCCRFRQENCTNCVDDNCNGLVDDTDSDCEDAEVPLGHCNCCVPGTWRWCDEMVYCAWGRQQCLPDGQWGGCLETSERPPGCEGWIYDLACCFDSGGCCQLSPYQPFSVGNCEGIITPCTY
jgi:hypothetical protein